MWAADRIADDPDQLTGSIVQLKPPWPDLIWPLCRSCWDRKGSFMLTRLVRNLLPSPALELLESRALLSADLAISLGALGTGFDRSNNPTIKLPVTVVNEGNTSL